MSKKNNNINLEPLIMCQEILKGVKITFDIDEIRTKCRVSDLNFTRMLIVYILRRKKFTVERIGQILNRDHSTVTYQERIFKNKSLKNANIIRLKQHLDESVSECDLQSRIDYHCGELAKLKLELRTLESKNKVERNTIDAGDSFLCY